MRGAVCRCTILYTPGIAGSSNRRREAESKKSVRDITIISCFVSGKFIQLCVCGQIISVYDSERIIKIGQYLRSYAQMIKGPVFFSHSVVIKFLAVLTVLKH